jgi:hypothetical protein
VENMGFMKRLDSWKYLMIVILFIEIPSWNAMEVEN